MSFVPGLVVALCGSVWRAKAACEGVLWAGRRNSCAIFQCCHPTENLSWCSSVNVKRKEQSEVSAGSWQEWGCWEPVTDRWVKVSVTKVRNWKTRKPERREGVFDAVENG